MKKSLFGIKINSQYSIALFCLFLGLLFVPSKPIVAQGDLLIFPKRVVFEGTKKAEILNLTNIGKDTATYKISFIQIRMNENGTFSNISEADPDQSFADPYIRYYPRSVTLGPNESQVVKLQLKKTNNLPDGEYRSHLYFRADKVTKPLGEEVIPTDTNTVSVKISALYGISIATIIKIGKSTTKTTFTDLSFERNADNVPLLKATFNRMGNMSTYGNIEVTHISPEGIITSLATVKGFAVYTPGKIRKATIKLKEPAGVDFFRGKLTLRYTTPPEAKSIKLAEAELKLSKTESLSDNKY
jgi:hypothetical protein